MGHADTIDVRRMEREQLNVMSLHNLMPFMVVALIEHRVPEGSDSEADLERNWGEGDNGSLRQIIIIVIPATICLLFLLLFFYLFFMGKLSNTRRVGEKSAQ